MPDTYGPLSQVEKTAVLECESLRVLKALRRNVESLEASLASAKNDIVRKEGEYQVVLTYVLRERGVSIPPGKKASVKTNPDGTVSIIVS